MSSWSRDKMLLDLKKAEAYVSTHPKVTIAELAEYLGITGSALSYRFKKNKLWQRSTLIKFFNLYVQRTISQQEQDLEKAEEYVRNRVSDKKCTMEELSKFLGITKQALSMRFKVHDLWKNSFLKESFRSVYKTMPTEMELQLARARSLLAASPHLSQKELGHLLGISYTGLRERLKKQGWKDLFIEKRKFVSYTDQEKKEKLRIVEDLLRKNPLISLRKLANILKVSYSTLSLWFKDPQWSHVRVLGVKDRKEIILEKARLYLLAHPEASKVEVAKAINISVVTMYNFSRSSQDLEKLFKGKDNEMGR